MNDDTEFCLGPPCEHFPPETTREQARDILAARTLKAATQMNYLLKRQIETAGERNEFGKLMEKTHDH